MLVHELYIAGGRELLLEVLHVAALADRVNILRNKLYTRCGLVSLMKVLCLNFWVYFTADRV